MPIRFDTIVEEIIYNKELCNKIWDSDGEMYPEVRNVILKVVKDFLKEDEHVKYKEVKDIQLTGSLANYNYNKYSDLDVHVLLDYEKINDDIDLVKRALDGKRFIWNMKHNIYIQGHEIELYFQDIHEPHISSGLFSIKNNNWVKKPSPTGSPIDQQDVDHKALRFINDINMLHELLQKADEKKEFDIVNKRAMYLDGKIRRMRRQGLKSKGEISIENLVFKHLRNTNAIEKLHTIIDSSYDQLIMAGKDGK